MYGWYLLSVQCFWWYAISDVVRVQRRKSPEVAFQTADILRRHAFEKESKFLAGRQSRPSSICLCYIVQWNLLLISIILSSFFHFNFHLEWKQGQTVTFSTARNGVALIKLHNHSHDIQYLPSTTDQHSTAVNRQPHFVIEQCVQRHIGQHRFI